MPPRPPQGFFGKLPARGDFLRVGLPRSFTDPLDEWLSRALTVARSTLGDRWDEIWRQAPAWRFALPPGACGPSPAAGVLLPSGDRIGRPFPLVIVRLGPASDGETAGFLAAAERAGREAIAHALAPEALATLTPTADAETLPSLSTPEALWWTADGRRLLVHGFPEPAAFAVMLQRDAEDPMTLPPIEAHEATGSGFRSSAASHPGTRRTANEDAWLNRPDLGLWAVADGAGGHQAGAVAARTAIAALEAIPPGLTGAELLTQLRLRLSGVHGALGRAAAAFGESAIMASTIVALVARQGHFACVWAGDSRLYRWQNDQLAQITRDHTLSDDGSAERNIITRALGSPAEEPELEKITGIVMPGDRFLLCSDGIPKVFDDQDLAAALTQADPASALVAAACDRGAADNVTAIIVHAIGNSA